MTALLDTSVVLASLDADEPQHAACDRLLAAGGHLFYLHGLAEIFSILTGGRQGRRLRAKAVHQLIEDSVLPFVKLSGLGGRDVLAGLSECEARGVRGGAVYDLLHLYAARKSGAARIVTLDVRTFQAFLRPGDPRVETV